MCGVRLQQVYEPGQESPHTCAVLAMHASTNSLPASSSAATGAGCSCLVTGDKSGLVAVWGVDGQADHPLTLWPTGPLPNDSTNTTKADEAGGKAAAGGLTHMRARVIDVSRMGRGAAPPWDPSVRSVCLHKGGHLLVGLASAEIYETKLKPPHTAASLITAAEGYGGCLEWVCRARGHSSGELWGLAVHPRTGVFVTGRQPGK